MLWVIAPARAPQARAENLFPVHRPAALRSRRVAMAFRFSVRIHIPAMKRPRPPAIPARSSFMSGWGHAQGAEPLAHAWPAFQEPAEDVSACQGFAVEGSPEDGGCGSCRPGRQQPLLSRPVPSRVTNRRPMPGSFRHHVRVVAHSGRAGMSPRPFLSKACRLRACEGGSWRPRSFPLGRRRQPTRRREPSRRSLAAAFAQRFPPGCSGRCPENRVPCRGRRRPPSLASARAGDSAQSLRRALHRAAPSCRR